MRRYVSSLQASLWVNWDVTDDRMRDDVLVAVMLL